MAKRLTDLLLIKPADEKGLGVFADEPIPAGALILTDNPIIKIQKQPYDVTEEDIAGQLELLNLEKRAEYMSLSPGRETDESIGLRILKSNQFATSRAWPCVCLRLSRFNHSCIPSAEWNWNESKGKFEVYAIRQIAEGEELYFCYHGRFDAMTREQRQRVTESAWGFTCTCRACSRQGQSAQLSDMRRQIINVLQCRLENREPLDFTDIENVCQSIAVQQRPEQHDEREKTLYLFLLAKLCEAEDMLDSRVSFLYMDAAVALTNCLNGFLNGGPEFTEDPVGTDAAIDNVRIWMLRSIVVMRICRGAGHDAVLELEQTASAVFDILGG